MAKYICINPACDKEAVGKGNACADCINTDYDGRRGPETKQCKVCKTDKPKDEFYGRHLTCIKCWKIKNSEKYKQKEIISMKCTTRVDLILPSVPSVIRTKSGVVFNIEDLSDEALETICNG